MLVCGCPASKGGILRAISPAGRRFRASALVSGRKNHDVYTFLCIHVHLFLVFAFRDAQFLSGLYHRFSYIVAWSRYINQIGHFDLQVVSPPTADSVPVAIIMLTPLDRDTSLRILPMGLIDHIPSISEFERLCVTN